MMMAEDSHEIPLAPRFQPRSDEETAISIPQNTRHQRSNKFVVYLLLAVDLLTIAFLIFGLIVLRFDSPQVKIEFANIKNLRYSTMPSAASLNMTVVAQVAIRNTNFGGFTFQNSSIGLLYGNGTFGVANTNGGLVKARKTSRIMDVTVQWGAYGLADRYLNFSSDINSGVLEISSYAELKGEIRALKIFTSHKIAVMNCSLSLNLTSQLIQIVRCV